MVIDCSVWPCEQDEEEEIKLEINVLKKVGLLFCCDKKFLSSIYLYAANIVQFCVVGVIYSIGQCAGLPIDRFGGSNLHLGRNLDRDFCSMCAPSQLNSAMMA